jgi:hypothetical protein
MKAFKTNLSQSIASLKNRKLLSFCITLILLISQISTELQIVDKIFKKYSDFENKETSDGLNFDNGKWFIIDKNDPNNKDERFLEFHPASGGFINYTNFGKITGQSFFSPSKVLVFYVDQMPIITSPIIDAKRQTGASESYVIEEIKKHIQYNKEFLNVMNSVPYFHMPLSYNINTNELWDFSNKLRIATNDPSIENIFDQYNIDLSEDAIEKMITKISIMVYNIYLTKSTKVFYDKNFITSLNGSGGAWDNKVDQFLELFDEKRTEIHKDSEIEASYHNLIKAINYFAHKCIRHYFFFNDKKFISDLFTGYQDNESIFSIMFDANIPQKNLDDIANLDVLKELQPEYEFDFNFINHVSKDDEENIKVNIENVLDSTLAKINQYVTEIIEFLDPEIQPLHPMSTPRVNLNKTKYLGTMLDDFKLVAFGDLYSKYTSLVKDGFYKTPELKNNSIKNLDASDQYKELRKRFVILGYLRS